ncbi:hypothetical protein A1O7_01136 [Cladophialophora yegresii CBS 114405]|uniref:Uncharacterized protein n=1 Tax=Cladophialophora yegresii CBS 114405 TaxID=1182544 RepID=W9WA06_9EURO|nr:uncharacterized protein A1O7_01136 [Cladophialophora yegresii CBS 114405]EXJ64798.1 hypothetical protein A1O7_01136 [Cladophialophora yegresii CBS 114405]
MCESHTIFHLCGHVNIKTIVQCADIIDKLLVSGTPIASNHQVCQDDVSDNVHVFPDICTKCRTTGVIGDVMDVPGVKLEVMKAWESQRKRVSAVPSHDNNNTDHVDTEDGVADKIRECETFERISLPDDLSTSTPDRAGASSSPTPATSSASSSTCPEPSPAPTPDLSQIKARVITLRARTERLLMKIRAHNVPKLG